MFGYTGIYKGKNGNGEVWISEGFSKEKGKEFMILVEGPSLGLPSGCQNAAYNFSDQAKAKSFALDIAHKDGLIRVDGLTLPPKLETVA